MPTYTSPRPVADHATWAPGTSCPMTTRDPYNFPIVASTPHDWYRPRIFVSGCENPANAASGSSGAGGGHVVAPPHDLPQLPQQMVLDVLAGERDHNLFNPSALFVVCHGS